MLFATTDEHCYKITRNKSENVEELKSSQEEADTRMLLYAKHAAANFETVTVVADDTDVLILAIALNHLIGCTLIIRCGKSNNIRLINTNKMATNFGQDVS